MGENECMEEMKGKILALVGNGANPCANAIRQEVVL